MNEQLALISNLYSKLKEKHEQARTHFKRPLTLTHKILASHVREMADESGQAIVPGSSYAHFYPDRVAMQDATAQMAMLQFMSANKDKVARPSTIHCDHLIQAHRGADLDLQEASLTN